MTRDDADQIRLRYSTGTTTQTRLAHEYGVTQPTISEIIHGRIWKTTATAHPPPPPIPGLTPWEARVFRLLEPDHFQDIQITQPIRAYLTAFNAHLNATRAGDTRATREAAAARHEALTHLESQKP